MLTKFKRVFGLNPDKHHPGRFEMVPMNSLKQCFAELDRTKRYTVTIKEGGITRSSEQNAFLWGVVYPTIRQHSIDTAGEIYSEENIHEFFKDKLPSDTEYIWGKFITKHKTTTTLTTKEFHDYLEYIFMVMAERGCVIPEPDFNWRSYRQPRKQAA